MMPLPFQQIAQISSERLLNGTLEGLLIAAVAWVMLRAAAPRNSETRFAVWFSALVAVVALPFLTGVALQDRGWDGTVRPQFTIPDSWAGYLFLGWAILASMGLARVAAGLWQLRKLRNSCVVVDEARLPGDVSQTLAEFRAKRNVSVCVSHQVSVPAAIGFLRPAIVLPAWTISELSPAELRTVILHELAHLRRWDDWTNMGQQIAGALFFFHPAVWWIGSQLSQEREMACDDMVLAETSDARAYAQCLISLAEKSFLRRGLALAQAAVGRVRETSRRVARILDAARPVTRGWKPAVALVGTFFTVCLVAAPHAPQLVAFGGPSAAPRVAATAFVPLDADRPPQSMIVRASLHTEPPAAPAKKARKEVPHRKLEIVPAAVKEAPKAPVLMRTSAIDVPAPRVMFVTVQSLVYEHDGVQWRIAVWHVTETRPEQPGFENEIVFRSL